MVRTTDFQSVNPGSIPGSAAYFCESSSVVECLLPKEKVAGSSPVSRFVAEVA